MARSASQSIKSDRATPNERPMTPTKNQSRNQSRRVSVAHSLHKAYGEVKKKGLCKCLPRSVQLINKAFGLLADNAIPTRFVVVFVAALSNTISYIMRTNMSVTIVAMVNHTTSGGAQDDSCHVN